MCKDLKSRALVPGCFLLLTRDWVLLRLCTWGFAASWHFAIFMQCDGHTTLTHTFSWAYSFYLKNYLLTYSAHLLLGICVFFIMCTVFLS
jgi:hypothetical protein